MTDKVIQFPGETTLDIDPDLMMENAKGELSLLVMMGYNDDGEVYFASSTGDMREVLWLMESLKQQMMMPDE